MGKCVLCKGDIFFSQAEIICHQVNCRGVMGAGIARAVRDRYPGIYETYKSICDGFCADGRSSELLGYAMILETEEGSGKYIANLFAQDGYRRGPNDRTVYTNYEALAKAVDDLAKTAAAYHIKTVAIPLNMGCGLAGGDWNKVKEILKNSFQNSPVDLEIWQL